jgi:hypothetical protein
MKRNFIKYLNVILLAMLFASCTKNDTDIPDQPAYVKNGEVVSNSSLFDVQFYSQDSLFVGYNKVYFKVKDKSLGQSVSQAAIILHPLMDMGTYKHACPLENPGNSPNSEGYFEGAVLFSMPGSNNSWSLSVEIDVNGKKDVADLPINKVVGTSPVKKIVVIDSLSNGPGSWIITKYPVSLVEPAEWKVGNNPFEVTVHSMASMMSFPCCSEMTIEITPEMPSMGHGSPNNVNPVLTSNGHYAGTVNFTMTGAWRVNMVFKKGGRTIGKKAYFDIDF